MKYLNVHLLWEQETDKYLAIELRWEESAELD